MRFYGNLHLPLNISTDYPSVNSTYSTSFKDHHEINNIISFSFLPSIFLKSFFVDSFSFSLLPSSSFSFRLEPNNELLHPPLLRLNRLFSIFFIYNNHYRFATVFYSSAYLLAQQHFHSSASIASLVNYFLVFTKTSVFLAQGLQHKILCALAQYFYLNYSPHYQKILFRFIHNNRYIFQSIRPLLFNTKMNNQNVKEIFYDYQGYKHSKLLSIFSFNSSLSSTFYQFPYSLNTPIYKSRLSSDKTYKTIVDYIFTTRKTSFLKNKYNRHINSITKVSTSYDSLFRNCRYLIFIDSTSSVSKRILIRNRVFSFFPSDYSIRSIISFSRDVRYFICISSYLVSKDSSFSHFISSKSFHVKIPKNDSLLPIHIKRYYSPSDGEAFVDWQYFGSWSYFGKVNFHVSSTSCFFPDVLSNSSLASEVVINKLYFDTSIISSSVLPLTNIQSLYIKGVSLSKNEYQAEIFFSQQQLLSYHKRSFIPFNLKITSLERDEQGTGCFLSWDHNTSKSSLYSKILFSEQDSTVPHPFLDSNTKSILIEGNTFSVRLSDSLKPNNVYYFRVMSTYVDSSSILSDVYKLDVLQSDFGFVSSEVIENVENITSIELVDGDSLLIAATATNSIILWRKTESSFRLESQWNTHDRGISAVSFDEKNNLLFTGGRDSTVRIWEKSGGCWIATDSILFHTDWISKIVFDTVSNSLLTSGYDGKIAVFKKEDSIWKLNQLINDNSDAILSFSLSTDASTLVSTSRDQTIKIYKRRLSEWSLDKDIFNPNDYSYSIAVNSKGTEIAYGSPDGIKIWSYTLGSWQRLTTLPLWSSSLPSVLLYSPNDSSLVVSGIDIKIWKRLENNTFATPPRSLDYKSSSNIPIAFDSTGNNLIIARESDVVCFTVN